MRCVCVPCNVQSITRIFSNFPEAVKDAVELMINFLLLLCFLFFLLLLQLQLLLLFNFPLIHFKLLSHVVIFCVSCLFFLFISSAPSTASNSSYCCYFTHLI